MEAYDAWPALTQRPRVVLAGAYRHPLGLPSDGLLAALSREADVRHLPAASPLRDGVRTLREAAHAVRRDGFEALHLLDARWAPQALVLRARLGVPVSASMSVLDATSRSPLAWLARRALRRLDHAIAADDCAVAALRALAPGLPVSVAPPAASELPWPSRADSALVERTLRSVRPGRLVIGLPWPANSNDFRWCRDAVLPYLEAKPVCLLFGVRNRRETKFMLRAAGAQKDVRILPGKVTASRIAAIARVVDAFVLPGASETGGPYPTALALALAVGGVPVVAGAPAEQAVLAHERNAFLSDPGDERDLVATLDRLLALPATQRHFLGQEFARFTLQRWPWDEAAQVYGDRFAALVGRPRIPAELRAA